MKKKRFSVEQIVAVLKQTELGVPVAEVIRKAGISEQTFYHWKAKYAGLDVDQVRQIAQLQEENLRLKKLVAELVLDKTMLQDVLSKTVKPSRCGPMADRRFTRCELRKLRQIGIGGDTLPQGKEFLCLSAFALPAYRFTRCSTTGMLSGICQERLNDGSVPSGGGPIAGRGPVGFAA